MKHFALLIFGLLISVNAYPGVRDIGNGGAGVLVDDKPVLLDLFEMGFTTGYIESQLTPLYDYVKAAQAVTVLTVDEQILLAKKLTEIHHISPRLALFLATALREYAWAVIDVNLNVIREVSPLNIETVQLANRLGTVVRIQKSYWELMDSSNRVALVLHEVVYAYAPVRLISGDFRPNDGVVPRDATNESPQGFISKQDSIPVRELIGILFLPTTDTTNHLKQGVIRAQWGPPMGFSMIDRDLITTFENLTVNGKPMTRTLPTLCDQLLAEYPASVVELSFDRVLENMQVSSYLSASGRQKSLTAYWLSSKPTKLVLNLKDQNQYSCAEQLKSALK